MNKDWIDITVLEDYLDGRLDAKAMNRVEREALEDPFVAEALAGLSNTPKRSLESISLLQKQLQERVTEQQQNRKASVITWQRLSIAATAAVLFISIGIIFWMKQNNYQEMLAKQPKKVDVNLAPKEFKDSSIKTEAEVATTLAKEEALRAKVIDKAIAVTKNKEALASVTKSKDKSISIAEPAPVIAENESATSLNEVPVVAAPQARQNSLTFSTTTISEPEATKTINGRVTDLNTGEALVNAAIYVSTPLKGVGSTGLNGTFSVNVPADATDLTFTYTGYENQQVKIIGNSIDVAMKEAVNQLNDVVIRGYQRRSREQTTGSSFIVTPKEDAAAQVSQILQGKVAGLNIASIAQPTNGWDKFRTYLIKTNRFGNETKAGQIAEYKFSIKNGRPINIVTVKGVSAEYDEEAMRLIKNGPGWKLPDPTRSEVSVVLKF